MKKLYIAICILFLATSSFSSSEVTIGGKTGQPHIIQVNGTSLRPRAYLNITGDSVTGVDYLGKTVITIDSVDDQVGAVTLNKWCIGDGTLVQCTENEPAGGGGASDSFQTWDLPSGENIVADASTDTATFTATEGISITGTAATDALVLGLTFKGHVTIDSSGAVGARPDMIDFFTLATPTTGDSVLFLDATDGALKQGDVDDLIEYGGGSGGGGDLLADGTVPMTADWDIGNFDFTFKSATGDGTIEGATMTQGGQTMYDANDTPSGELGGTYANITIDDSVTVDAWVLGDSTATTINKVTVTAPASAATLTIADGKTLTATNTVNLNTMTDGKWCDYTTVGTVINCDRTEPAPTDSPTFTTAFTATGLVAFASLGTDLITGAAAVGTFASGDTFLCQEAGVGVRECDYDDMPGAAGATAWDDIGDPDNDGTTTIDFDHAAEATEFTTIYDAAGSFFKITDSDADVANQMYLLDLDYSADDDQALADYFRCQDAGGTVFAVQQDGDTEIYGDLAVGSNLHPTISVNGVTKSIQFGVHGDDDANTYVSYMDRASDTHSPTVAIVRARGAHGAPTQVVDDDILGQIGFFGWDDTDNDLNIGAHIRAVVNGTAGQNDLPTELIFGTTLNGETTPTDRMSISNAGVVNIVGLTASEMVITDASSNLVSAAVATYPSLAELAYVKGVSSAIQTQITTNAELVDSAAELLAIMDNTALDFGTGVITAAGFTLAANENLTLGGETIDHDGTDFVFSDSIKTTNINITGLTASEIVITDASKNIVSAPVATYPSLAELAYVKDVTGAIQGQIDAKAPLDSPTFATKMTLDYATASELVSTNASKELVSLAVATYPSLTELAYVKGVSSAIQTQITDNAALVDSAAKLLAIMDNTALDFGTGVITAAGFTLAANENLTLGGQTVDHDGTNFVFNDTIASSDFPAIGNDPDVATAGYIGRDNDDHWLRGYDGTIQFIYGQKTKVISGTATNPDLLTEAAFLPVWTNQLGASFVIDNIYAVSDVDDAAFTLKYTTNGYTDHTNLTTIEAITIATNSTGIFSYTIAFADIDNATIVDGATIGYDAGATDCDFIHFAIEGHLLGDVN